MSNSPMPVESPRRRVRRASLHVGLGTTALLGIFIYALGLDWPASNPGYTDFGFFHASARSILEGGSLYEPISGSDPDAPGSSSRVGAGSVRPNLNPPFQAVALSPIGRLDFRRAFLTWAGLSIVCGGLAALLIGVKGSGAKDPAVAGLVLLNLLVFYYPTLISVLIGQWSLVLLLFLVLAWLAWRRGRLGIAGGILGGLAGIKLFFGAFLIFFLVRREWRACLLFLVSGLASVTVSVLIAGPDPLFEYLRVLGDVGWYSASWNASILGFVNRVFGEPGNDPLLSMPLFASILGKILTLLAVGLLVFMARRGVGGAREPSLGSKDLAFSSCIVLMLLISPLGWMYYFPFLLIPLAVVWRETRHLTREGWVWFLLVPAWLLSSTPGTLVQFDHLEGDALLILGWSGAYFYALLLLLVILFRVQERALGMARAA